MSRILQRMDQARMTGLHRRLAWAAGLGIFLDGYDLVIIGVALVQLHSLWHLASNQIGWLGSAALAGSFVGALAGGRIADRLGRKAIYLIDLATFFVAAMLCGLSWNIASLVIFRFLLGVGIGADYPLSATYMAEFIPSRKRGAVITWAFGLWMVGAIIAGLVGYVFLYDPANGWRWMFILGALPALLVVYLRGTLPESPRWYLRHNRPEAAAAVVARLDPTITPDQMERILAQEKTALTQKKMPLGHLFKPPYLRATLLVCLPWFIMDAVGYYLTVYAPLVLSHLGFRTHHSQVLGSAILNASFIIGYVPLALWVDRIGRIWPQILGFLGSGAALLAVALAAQPGTDAVSPAGPVFSGSLLAIIFGSMLASQIANSFGPGSTTYLLAAEVYPTDLRATGHGFATAFSRLGAVISTFFLPAVAHHMGTPHFLMLLAVLSAFGGVLTWLFRMETARRPLEQEETVAARSAPTAKPT